MSEIIIHDGNYADFINPTVNGELRYCTAIPRTIPFGEMQAAKPFDLDLIPESQWESLLAKQVAARAQLSDIRNRGMNGKVIPSRDQNGKGYCVLPGTMIRMADGSQKPIEEIRLLERVLTAEGNIGEVKQCHVRDYEGELVKIGTYGHGHLRCTPNHSVMTRRGYVPAGELTSDDWVCIPRYAPQWDRVVVAANHIKGTKRRLARVGGEERWATSLPEDWHANVNRVPDVLKLTPGVGRIFGYWLAEGFFDRNVVTWAFGSDEDETLVADLVSTIRDEWGLEPTVKPGPGTNVTLVEIGGVLWRQLFESLCGKYAHGKRIHADLMSGPQEFLSALFWAWMAGDGCARGRRGKAYRCGATVSHSLALNMYDIANAIGLSPSINREESKPNAHAKTRRPAWKVQVNPDPSGYRANYRLIAEESRVWRKVRETTRIAYVGKVYNIGVEGDNSYVAEGIGVHNCWAHSSVSAALIIRAVNNQPYADLSAYAVACIIKNYRNQGGWGGESLEFIAERGVPTSEFWPQQSMSRGNDNPNTWANARLHRFTDWMDLDPGNMKAQLVTCLLLGIPVISDFNWWGHSVCTIDLVSLNPFRTRIWNSWGDSWSQNGTGLLEGRRAIPSQAWAPRLITAAVA